MKKPILHTGKALTKVEQKSVIGQGLKKGGSCCNPSLSCCVPNPSYNGNNCQFILGNSNAFPVPFCI